MSLFVSLGFVCIRPSPQLHHVRPACRLVSLEVLAPVALSMAIKVAGQGIAIGLLKRQSWYSPTEHQVLEACAWHAFELYSWHDLSKPKGFRHSAHHFGFSAAVAQAANLMQSGILFNHCATSLLKHRNTQVQTEPIPKDKKQLCHLAKYSKQVLHILKT